MSESRARRIIIFQVAIALLVLVVAGLIVVTKARAHDDMAMVYPAQCCGGDPVTGDCAPLEGVGAVERRADGWFIPASGETIPFSRTQPSQDLRFHRCVKPDGTTRCLFSPQTAG